MKIRIWRRVPRVWCWRCPVCGKTWRNRQHVPIRRLTRSGKYYPRWSTELNTPDAWRRCVHAAHIHIKRYHGATITKQILDEEKK